MAFAHNLMRVALHAIICHMIKSWHHKGLRNFFETGKPTGISPEHETRLKIILQRLNAAVSASDMNTPGMKFHQLKGKRKSYFSVRVSGNWRIIFKFEGKDAILVDYLDYH